MSASVLRSAITGLFIASAPLGAQAEQATPPDLAQDYIALCTAHKATYESVAAEMPAKDAQDLLSHYKDLNADYAQQLEKGGYNPAPCFNLG